MQFFGGDSPLLATAATVVCWGGAGLSVKPLHAPIRRRLVERGGRRREATIEFKAIVRLLSLIRSDRIRVDVGSSPWRAAGLRFRLNKNTVLSAKSRSGDFFVAK